jgi:[ribosomal protein S18]-alanine N-acetyltransferase
VKIVLRLYQPDDFETLYEIDQACYASDVAYSRSDLRAYLGFLGSECIVAEVQRESDSTANKGRPSKRDKGEAGIVGFCVSAHRDREGYIITMDVLQEYRRQGVGSALLVEIERRLAALGVRRVGLETGTDNQPAVAFWQRHGYRTRSVRKGYYPRGGDAYSMTKRIGPSGARRA